ncbi:BolA family protein [Roseateles sp. BYS180W]|uniref:BolA family protein n=1 Tax=Roseateles rivi TaxID=3299028 RepID=A0ABW7FW20_9BURK
MSTPPRAQASDIEARLRAALNLLEFELQDDSAAHAGHAGAREGGHFRVRLVSTAFEGKSRVARHRLVYDALAELMQRGIHALVIDAKTPTEAQSLRSGAH